MRASRVVVPLISFFLAAACSYYHTDSVRFDQALRPATVPDSMRVLGQTPTQPHHVVAMVSVTTDFAAAGGYERLTWRLAEQAARLGGHALLLGPESVTTTEKTQTLTGKVVVYDGALPGDGAYATRRSLGGPNRAVALLLILAVVPVLINPPQ